MYCNQEEEEEQVNKNSIRTNGRAHNIDVILQDRRPNPSPQSPDKSGL